MTFVTGNKSFIEIKTRTICSILAKIMDNNTIKYVSEAWNHHTFVFIALPLLRQN